MASFRLFHAQSYLALVIELMFQFLRALRLFCSDRHPNVYRLSRRLPQAELLTLRTSRVEKADEGSFSLEIVQVLRDQFLNEPHIHVDCLSIDVFVDRDDPMRMFSWGACTQRMPPRVCALRVEGDPESCPQVGWCCLGMGNSLIGAVFVLEFFEHAQRIDRVLGVFDLARFDDPEDRRASHRAG